MPLYEFQHPLTEEIFEDLRSYKDADLPFIAPDGTKCKRIISSCSINDGSRDIDSYNDVRKGNPRTITFKNGKKELYNPNKHGYSAGSEHKPFKRKGKK